MGKGEHQGVPPCHTSCFYQTFMCVRIFHSALACAQEGRFLGIFPKLAPVPSRDLAACTTFCPALGGALAYDKYLTHINLKDGTVLSKTLLCSAGINL